MRRFGAGAIAWVLAAGTLAVALAAGVAAARDPERAQGERLTVERHDHHGAYLADGKGRALYMFTPDRDGESTCYEACARAWPPLVTRGDPDGAEGIDGDRLGTTTRRDGTRQVTYAGWPLYTFARDTRAGTVTGQGVQSFGGAWYLMSPDGEVIRKAPRREASAD